MGAGRGRRTEAARLVQGRSGVFHVSFSTSCRGTGTRLIEDR